LEPIELSQQESSQHPIKQNPASEEEKGSSKLSSSNANVNENSIMVKNQDSSYDPSEDPDMHACDLI
jgi:hypothetical protein